MGGNSDSSGHVDAEKLIKIIRDEFEMTIDIERLIKEIDTDGSGEIEYDEFKTLLSNYWKRKKKIWLFKRGEFLEKKS